MMLSEDIRECNRLERNAKRLQKVLDIMDMVQKENNVSGLDLTFISLKVAHAQRELVKMRETFFK